jgi:hypothetical protein
MQLTIHQSGATIIVGRDIPRTIASMRSKHLLTLDTLRTEIAKSNNLDAIRAEQMHAQNKIEEINSEAQTIAELLEFKASAIKSAGNFLIEPNAGESMLKHVDAEIAQACRTLKGASGYFGDSRRNIGHGLIKHADELLALSKSVGDSAQKSKRLLRVIGKKLDYHIVKNEHARSNVAALTQLHGGSLKELQEKTARLAKLREESLAGDYDAALEVEKLHPAVLELRKEVMDFVRKHNDAQLIRKQEVTAQFKYELTAYRKSAFGKAAPIDLARELDAEIGETL